MWRQPPSAVSRAQPALSSGKNQATSVSSVSSVVKSVSLLPTKAYNLD